MKDLQGNTVEFKVAARARGYRVRGTGKFLVRRNAKTKDQLAVRIVVLSQGRNWAELFSTHHTVLQAGMDRLCRHPDPEIAEFLLE
jgi:hypothetical protein